MNKSPVDKFRTLNKTLDLDQTIKLATDRRLDLYLALFGKARPSSDLDRRSRDGRHLSGLERVIKELRLEKEIYESDEATVAERRVFEGDTCAEHVIGKEK